MVALPQVSQKNLARGAGISYVSTTLPSWGIDVSVKADVGEK